MPGLLGRAEGALWFMVLNSEEPQPHCVVCSVEWLRRAGHGLRSTWRDTLPPSGSLYLCRGIESRSQTTANQTNMRQYREEGSERCEWLWKEFDDGEGLGGTQPWVGTPAFPPQPGGSMSGSLKSSDFLTQKFSKLTF